MAKPRVRKVFLKEYYDGRVEADMIEFEPEEYIEVLPLGGLPRPFFDRLMEARNRWQEDQKKDEDQRDPKLIADLEALQKEERGMAVKSWFIQDTAAPPDSEGKYPSYPLPSEEPDVFDRMDVNLQNSLYHVMTWAFSPKDDRERRLGEDSGSAPASEASGDTPSSTPSDSPKLELAS